MKINWSQILQTLFELLAGLFKSRNVKTKNLETDAQLKKVETQASLNTEKIISKVTSDANAEQEAFSKLAEEEKIKALKRKLDNQ